ncbi:carbonic anhydrase [Luteimicrobium xylanilyticum]|uniref:Carbonic anhydrase n=1 Tax=Luteimicrobium xylanilyticum TaxID=1133546 RepID=A0A5P9Q8U4_9MICO|nr:carbonic anhydrase [Luteimicrobium xylanilyticum]QFU97570.1 Carbonic anhydrase [Luteimicrobium xylanilyticum]
MPTPAESWSALREGNARFVRDEMAHPSQDTTRRQETALAQHPFGVVFGCSDSRVASELIFDQGLGDLFVVRNAGHVVDPAVLGSIEFGVEILGANLVVVLGHSSCGAVAAAASTLRTGEEPPGFVRAVTDGVIPSIVGLTAQGPEAFAAMDEALLLSAHVRHTVAALPAYSAALRTAVDEGRCAIVGVEYDLREGEARLVAVAGDVGETPVA